MYLDDTKSKHFVTLKENSTPDIITSVFELRYGIGYIYFLLSVTQT